MNSIWRRFRFVAVGLPLLLSLTGCPKIPKAVRSRIPGASGETKLNVKVHVSPTANKNNPVAVDLVLVSDKKLLKELMKMSARDWFEQRHQVQLDYPKETDLGAGSWEWVPGQAVKLDRLPVRLEIVGGVVFANYFNEGPHRAVINPRKDILLTLGEDDLCVQLATEVAKPCPSSKNPTKNPISEKQQYQHRVRSVLVWDQGTLRQVIALNDQYESFVETRSYKPSERLDSSVKKAARARGKVKIRNLLLRARKYQPLAQVTEGFALKASLITEVQYLQNAQATLTRVLEISTRLGVDRELRAALSEQGAYLLRGIHREFVAQQFYVAKQSDFNWWDGRQPVSYFTYDLGSPEELAAYLNIQRKGIAFLGRGLAVPVRTFFEALKIYVPPDSQQLDWDMMIADLDAYDNKTPGNPIAELENFIRTDMDKVSLDGCSSAVPPYQSSADYFLRIRNSLRVQFYARCSELALIKAKNDTVDSLDNYHAIEDFFNQNLAGRFPFASTTQPQLDPWAMIKFFKVMDDKEKAAREALNRSSEFGVSDEHAIAATAFLDQMDKVREFFAPFLEKKQDLSFDFGVQFRVQPEQPGQEETGGNQIIDWKLEVGKKELAYRGDDLTGHWDYVYPGLNPIRLTLRWARNSPTRPLPGTVPVRYTVKDRTTIFEYDDPWSLFTLVLKHGFMLKRAGAPADCDRGFDADPYTLKFTIKTEPDPLTPPGQRQDLMPSPAQVFMRVRLVAPNKQGPLMLPCFPTKAPKVDVPKKSQ